MSKIYANLIIKGLKTINDVPDKLKEEVQALLNEIRWENGKYYIRSDSMSTHRSFIYFWKYYKFN